MFFLNPIWAELTKPALRFCGGEAHRRSLGGNGSIVLHSCSTIVRHHQLGTSFWAGYACPWSFV